ncbi:MAG: hypothetical protein KDD69_16030 [Bdellovibrionales bacterium]|nr:hypothetical protein [Bdellovibrionales bacterium]
MHEQHEAELAPLFRAQAQFDTCHFVESLRKSAHICLHPAEFGRRRQYCSIAGLMQFALTA